MLSLYQSKQGIEPVDKQGQTHILSWLPQFNVAQEGKPTVISCFKTVRWINMCPRYVEIINYLKFLMI